MEARAGEAVQDDARALSEAAHIPIAARDGDVLHILVTASVPEVVEVDVVERGAHCGWLSRQVRWGTDRERLTNG